MKKEIPSEVAGFRVHVARTFFQRARGLIRRPAPPKGDGLLILRCNAIHTFFMSYPIDAIFVDRHFKPVKIVRGIPPGRFIVWGGWKAAHVVETAVAASHPS